MEVGMATDFCWFLSTEMIIVKAVASGAAGRANVGLCPASSFSNNYRQDTQIINDDS